MANFERFVTAQHWLAVPNHALGLRTADHDYVDESGPSLPALLTSARFLNLLSSQSGYPDAVDLIKQQNAALPESQKWTVALFESRFLLSADQAGYGRLLVFIPGRSDLWVSFAIATPQSGDPDRTQSVSVVEVGPNETFLMDYLRDSGRLVPLQQVRRDASDRCYDCHKAPANPIWPLNTYGFSPNGNLVATNDDLRALNDRIRGYGRRKMVGIDPNAFGPSLGPRGRPRTDAFIRESAGSELSSDSISRIRQAMNCASCHDSFAPLDFPAGIKTSRDVHALKSRQPLAETYVESGQMPPGNTLTATERRALWQSLSREYFDPRTATGLLADWLMAG